MSNYIEFHAKVNIFRRLTDRVYSKSTALIQSSAKPVGVLGPWYSWNVRGELEANTTFDKNKKHQFISTEFYRGTICKPFYEQQTLKVSLDTVKKLNHLNDVLKLFVTK